MATRLAVVGVVVMSTLFVVAGAVRAATVEPVDPATSSAIDVTFACTSDQTPELVVPLRDYDETFPAGTATTTFDFVTLEFADTRILVDCTPYDDADIECFEVALIADTPDSDPTLQTSTLQPADCAFIGPRPLDGAITPTTTTTSTTTTIPPGGLPETGSSTNQAATAAVLVLIGVMLVRLGRRRNPRRA
jgi:LPXTG-motif cell wall-anchored protein